MFGFMFAGAISGSQVSHLPILIPGIIAQTAVAACVAAGIQLREDIDKDASTASGRCPSPGSPPSGNVAITLHRLAVRVIGVGWPDVGDRSLLGRISSPPGGGASRYRAGGLTGGATGDLVRVHEGAGPSGSADRPLRPMRC